jgi:hypothetical protein
MHSFHLTRITRILLVLGFFYSFGRAQESQNSSAIIHRIADSSGPKAIMIEGETDKVQLQREEIPDWQNAKSGLELSVGDRLKLEPYMHVDLRIAGTQEGQLIALPNPPDGGGTFRLQEDPSNGTDGFVIALESGSMSIDWVRGKLTVIAYSIRTLISGTKVAFLRDPETNKRILFLDDDTVSFPDHPGLKVEPGDMVVLEPGIAPVVTKISPQKQAWLRGIIRYNAADIWEKPIILRC